MTASNLIPSAQPLVVDGFIFDLDGTVYLGETALPGAVETMRELARRNKKIVFVSNKPLSPREEYAAKLNHLGIPISADAIITSAFVLAHHLASTSPGLRLYVIGEAYLIAELRAHGLTVVDDPLDQDPKQVIQPPAIDAVVVAFDRTLDYRKLNTAYQALSRGARFFATNADRTCPLPGGTIPDAGAIIAALEYATGRRVDLLAGKPSALMMQVALERLGLPAQKCMIVGDRPETDMRMGQKAGMLTALTLTGISTAEDAARLSPPPDLIIEQLAELVTLTA